MPTFFTTKILSASPAGRGAYVPSLSTIFFAVTGAASLMRVNVNTNIEAAQLAVAGATSLRSLAFNSSDGFLYAADMTGANNTIRKINPSTGASTLIAPGDSVGNDLVFSPSNNTVIFSGGGTTLTRVDTAGVVTQSAAFAGASGSGLEAGGGSIWVGTTTGIAKVSPSALTMVQSNNATSYRPVTFGTTSLQLLLGRNIGGANGVIDFDGVSVFNNLAGAPNGTFQSGGYIPKLSSHCMVDTVNGVAWFFDDTSAVMGAVLGQFAVGVCTGSVNDSFPLVGGANIYIPAGTSKALNVFH